MTTMPHALFTTVIFIGGEWMSVDLQEPWGEICGAALALIGLGVVGIPISIIFDGYSEISEDFVEKYITGDGDGDAEGGGGQVVLVSAQTKGVENLPPELKGLDPKKLPVTTEGRQSACCPNGVAQ